MPGRIAIMTTGLWRMRSDVGAVTGLTAVFTFAPFLPAGVEAVAGWGHKPTAERARLLAKRRKLPYVAIEDGFLRSVRPGPEEPPQSLILDRSGIYYDARATSDLEQLLNAKQPLDTGAMAQARDAVASLRTTRLSKYNDAPPFPPAQDRGDRPVVMVIDQTRGDASIAGGLADRSTFAAMLGKAIAENPGARIIIKLHPETLSGRKLGYLAELALRPGVELMGEASNPWHMFEFVDKVYTVSSQLGFEALMAGCEVVCFGMPFYAGWGLTDDRQAVERRINRLSLEQLVHTVFFDYCRYLCAWTRQPIDFSTAVDQLAFRRDHFHRRTRPVVCAGITAWKRPVVRAMMSGRAGEPSFVRRADGARQRATDDGADIAAWGRRAAQFANPASDCRTITIEDGFLRSVGLGAGFVTPISLVFDQTGIYYDPSRPSDLETILQHGSFSDDDRARGRALRELIVNSRLTKYNLQTDGDGLNLPPDKPVILVPGQVADDESIRLGATNLSSQAPLAEGGANLALLRAVRARNPDAHIIYKPHPDVEAGFRAGRIAAPVMAELADEIYSGAGITSLFKHVSAVETATSLAGFEALLRDIPVVTHGTPFYAGWGLTEDLAPNARRTCLRTLDELVAACLIRYPLYVAPGTRHVCPVEIAAQLLVEERKKPQTMASWSQSLAKKAFAKLRYITINLFGVDSGPRV